MDEHAPSPQFYPAFFGKVAIEQVAIEPALRRSMPLPSFARGAHLLFQLNVCRFVIILNDDTESAKAPLSLHEEFTQFTLKKRRKICWAGHLHF